MKPENLSQSPFSVLKKFLCCVVTELDIKTSCSRQVAAHLSPNMKGCHRSSVSDAPYITSHPNRVVPIMYSMDCPSVDKFSVNSKVGA